MASNRPNIVAIDPASRVVGYAAFCGGRVVEAGRCTSTIKPLDARIRDLWRQLHEVLADFQPDTIVIELPMGKQHTRNAGKKSGMAVWSGAAWALWAFCCGRGVDVVAVDNCEWTRGHSKSDRKLIAAAACREYDAGKDDGGDVADAIGLGLWWLARHDPIPQHEQEKS